MHAQDIPLMLQRRTPNLPYNALLATIAKLWRPEAGPGRLRRAKGCRDILHHTSSQPQLRPKLSIPCVRKSLALREHGLRHYGQRPAPMSTFCAASGPCLAADGEHDCPLHPVYHSPTANPAHGIPPTSSIEIDIVQPECTLTCRANRGRPFLVRKACDGHLTPPARASVHVRP